DGWSYYLGDPHAHTGVSGDGSFFDAESCRTCAPRSQIFQRARNNGLDWVAFSEHMNTATSATPVAFAELRADVLAQDRPGTFVTIPAAEVALADADGATLGHRTMLFFGDIAQLHTMQLADLRYNGQDTDIGNCENVAAWAASLSDRFGPMLLVPHHTGAARPAPVDWGCHHPEFEPVAEVYSEHGSSMYSDYAWDPPNSGGVAIGSIESALDPDMYGLRLGFIAGTDSHDSDPGDVCRRDLMVGHATAGGLTVAMIPETETFTRAALLEAFQQRSTYATTGPLIPVQLQFVSLGMDLGYMGQDIALPEGQPLAIELNYPPEFQPWVASVALRAPGARWEMQRSGAGRWSYHFAPAQVPELLYAEIQVTGRMWNAGECDDGGTDDAEWIWLSPSWVNLVDGDVDGDGWSWAEGDCREGDPTIGRDVPEQWYDGIDQNCDGKDDDQDSDGFLHDQDCDDQNARVRPDAAEVWYDGIDQNCDGKDDDQD
ncbi:MAG TPA: MopE-related protein, partial [Myxococcota bacterium]|nr:MopE-related protein [Myxococcota bacterium]